MYGIIRGNKRHEKDVRIQQLKQLLEDSTSDEDGSRRRRRKNGSTNLPSQMRVLTKGDKDLTCSTFSSQELNTVAKEQRKMQSDKVPA
uniref:Uncharacterized protein n=1 Tax=Theropithecus gelada TaxID=9565 RepID=A0A8D2FI11_THEGE